MAQLLKDCNLNRNGTHESVNAANELQNKIVALYFSAHWCPPCKAFTPELKIFYENVLKEFEKEFDIVFVSFDRSKEDLEKYLNESHGKWLYIPFGNEIIRELKFEFNVTSIPTLIILKPDGTVISKNGRSDVQTKQAKNLFLEWKNQL